LPHDSQSLVTLDQPESPRRIDMRFGGKKRRGNTILILKKTLTNAIARGRLLSTSWKDTTGINPKWPHSLM
jgi:hypothetical protein